MKKAETAAHILRGEATRKRVLDLAVKVATIEGLEALTIGRIADAVQISKAGLLGHFGTKEDLQIATVRAGREKFIRKVIYPIRSVPEGLPRLVALIDSWVDYVRQSEGGCFFASVSAEFDSKPGAVRDAVSSMIKEWQSGLTKIIEEAKNMGHLKSDVAPKSLAFAFQGYELALNLMFQLLGEKEAVNEAKAAMRRLILNSVTLSGKRALAKDSNFGKI
ncbi:transcriptional regulator, TetR family [Leptospira inadai serovar Lyme str. 10]|uniref:Transcriptional regulator, TetR family n=2 Tax=Leptospira inadai serovar Lyme TaxID=293084 RepID=V6HFK0_9LEPT|nr:TetR/AcrR family transcriptional regulator [Leptospira inadai]EQA38488.1 transcriptional regulator, TetR family [Leptospira inadai serovar Lyme str. 10]PNV72423.1 TetR/AcrR family transcriptional regulator [Leptospira inadai serovar Lyme]